MRVLDRKQMVQRDTDIDVVNTLRSMSISKRRVCIRGPVGDTAIVRTSRKQTIQEDTFYTHETSGCRD